MELVEGCKMNEIVGVLVWVWGNEVCWNIEVGGLDEGGVEMGE